jgi:putative ABC transport system substrate-binding protein
MAAELVALKPDVLLTGGANGALPLQGATDSIPIVFASIPDPVGLGLVASYARPGGNITGTTSSLEKSLGPKFLDLLRQLIPGLTRVAIVLQSGSATGENDIRAIQAAAQSIGIDAQAVEIGPALDINDLERTLDAALADNPEALISTVAGSFLTRDREPQPANAVIMGFATQRRLPTVASGIGVAGNLLYYGHNLVALYRHTSNYYVDRILRGAKPADLPVEGPTVFDLIVNRTTAQALGLTIPPDLAAQVTQWVD